MNEAEQMLSKRWRFYYMLRSMYSGISGLRANQTKLDVIGNNIANVNTTGFKTQRIRFQDMLSQSMKQATGAGYTVGGTNPSQIGLGVDVAGVDTLVTQGNMQPTGRNLDFMVDGDGYFLVAKGPNKGKINIIEENHTLGTPEDEANSLETSFTRDGSFTLDDLGQLLTSNGQRVLGYQIAGSEIHYEGDNGKPEVNVDEIPEDYVPKVEENQLMPLLIPDKVKYNGADMRIKNFSVDKNGIINAVLENNKSAGNGQIAMAAVKNPARLQKDGKNLYSASANSGEAVIRTGAGKEGEENNEGGYGDVVQGCLEMSNVDLDRKSTRLNSSHANISYAVFCLKKKKK